MSVTLTSKGQVTIPKAVRNSLHLKTRDKLELVVEQQDQGWLALRDFGLGNADFSDYLIVRMNQASSHQLFRLLK